MLEALRGVIDAIISMGIYAWALIIIGVITGLLVGVLPGLTFVMGVILLVPFTYGMETDAALILLVALYVAGTYGGALTSILIRIPGEPNNVPLLWDGYNMTREGRAAEALGWAATAALAGGLAAWLLLVLAARPFASVALNLGSHEYFVIIMLGLASVLVLAEASYTGAIVAMFAGMLITTVGVDQITGVPRFTLGTDLLLAGVNYLIVLIGMYALGEVILRFSQNYEGQVTQQPGRITTTIPSLRALRDRSGSFLRGIIAGTSLGAVPGAGATVAAFVAYNMEKQFGKHKGEVGKASPNGIISPQAAATATVGGALIPLLVLGIPGSVATAVLLGVFLLHNVQPGPQIFVNQPELVYTIFGALLISLFFMFAAGILGAGPLIRLLNFPEVYVGAFVVLFAFVGSYALRSAMADVWIMVAFGVLGFFMQRGGYPIAPLVLGAVLGPLAERHFRTAMISSANDWTTFFTRPISGVLMAILILMIVFLSYRAVRLSRERRAEVRPGTGGFGD